ncbi:MAG: hypothetical protein ACRDUY_15995 [Nitriliruptorales bacterium]
MTNRTRLSWTISLTVGAWLLVVAPANAYIDGGTGAFIFQAIIAFALAASVTLKMQWRRLKGLFGGAAPVEETVDEPAAAPSDEA